MSLNSFKKIFIILLLSMHLCSANSSGKTFLLAHNGDTAITSLLGQAQRTQHKNNSSDLILHGVLSFGQLYSQSTNKKDLGEYFFFNGSNTMKFGPAKTTSNDTDVFALNFLLDESYEGTATLKPEVKTYAASLQYYMSLEKLISGLWFSANVPLVHTSWNPGLKTTTETENGATFADHAFINGTNSGSPYTSIDEAWKGDRVPERGYYTNKWSYGIIDGSHSQTAIGNAKIALNYNFLNRDDAYFGFGLMGLLNGSPKSKAKYLFEPTIGTAGRFGTGICVEASAKLYERDTKKFNYYFHADVTHIFGANMRRSYDYTNNGKGSRYLLIRKHSAFDALEKTDGVLSSINVTSLRAKISMDVLYDVQMLFRWSFKRWNFDFGYKLYGHTKEKHEKWIDTITPATFTFYAAGNANVEGLGGATGAVKLFPDITIDGTQGTAGANMTDATALSIAGITEKNLNISSGLQPSVVSHCVYAGFTYSWDSTIKQPFISIGGGYEMSSGNKALHQWNIALCGGVTF